MERPDVADELERLAAEDLTVRQRLADTGELFGNYHPEMQAIHRRNGDRLQTILDEVGAWPGNQLVDDGGSEAALLIAQHDIANPRLMRRCLDLYTAAVEQGDAEPSGVAFLEDRIRAFEGRLQRYGTQVGWDDNGDFGPWPAVEEPDRVDERRAALGLAPLADAIRAAGTERPPRRAVDTVLRERRQIDDFARETGWRGAD